MRGFCERGKRVKKQLILLFPVVLALVAAACSGEAEDKTGLATLEGVGEDATAVAEGTASADVDAEEAWISLLHSACETMEFRTTPIPPQRGRVHRFWFCPRRPRRFRNRSPVRGIQRHHDICAEHLEGIALGRGGEGFDETELTDTLLAFAQCMRDHGVPMDDPDLSGFGPGRGEDGGGGPFSRISTSKTRKCRKPLRPVRRK